MSLYLVVTGNTINALDVNQIVNVMQAPSGNTETQTAVQAIMGTFQTSSTVGVWVKSNSQGSTPVSAATSATTLTGVGSLSTSSLGISGVNVNGAGTGVSNTARFVTTVTFQY